MQFLQKIKFSLFNQKISFFFKFSRTPETLLENPWEKNLKLFGSIFEKSQDLTSFGCHTSHQQTFYF